MSFESMLELPAHLQGQPAIWFCVSQSAVVVREGASGLELLEAIHPRELGLEPDHEHFLGTLDGRPVWAAGIDRPFAPSESLRAESLFTLFSHVSEPVWALAGRAVQMAEWHRTHRFCGRCGAATEAAPGERARRCPECALLSFPRLAPAVITLVEREGRALLARGRAFGATPMYSVLAGFVEPGETLEEAVAREIREEVGVDVAAIRYHSSQPWPFPHSLMIGFTAKWAGGEIACDPSEIVDANWYAPDDLPNIPGKLSIARRLIDDWLARSGG
jgi:NAD+ diphosphatase